MWKSPGDICRNQIDYILVKARFKNAIQNCKTSPGADIGSDHNPVIMKMRVKLKIPANKTNKCIKYDTDALKESDLQTQYAVEVKNRFDGLKVATEEEPELITPEQDIKNLWEKLKTAIHETNKAILPKRKKETSKPWMTTEILELMKSRKEHKGRDRYKEYDKLVKKKCTEAKEEWYNSKCTEIESMSRHGNQASMYQKIKDFAYEKKASSGGCIKDKNGEILFETRDIMKRWREYVEELFKDERNESNTQAQGKAQLF